MNYEPSQNQWKFIMKMWPNIPYNKLNDKKKKNFLSNLAINQGFGHPKQYRDIIENFIAGKIEVLPDTIVKYYQAMEKDLMRKLGYGN
jgi:hypothetical protein